MRIQLVIICVVVGIESVGSFSIGPLLSTCIDAARAGCHEIRTVQQQINKTIEFVLKDENDVRSALTVADQKAQNVIVGRLRATWGDSLHIVGEEEEEEDSGHNKEYAPLDQTLLQDDLDDDVTVESDQVTIFIDPLDGTREFCQGRLANCQVLVGIAVQGQALAGAIGIPFPAGDNNLTAAAVEPTVVYGLDGLGSGTIGTPLTRGPWPLAENVDGVSFPRPQFATGDSPVECIGGAVERCVASFGGSRVIYGGAGNKILGAALEEVAASMQHKVGGAWDLCAPAAVCHAMGGTVTNLFGDPIDMYRDESPVNANCFGYIASPVGSDHRAIVAAVNSHAAMKAYRKEVDYDAILAATVPLES